MKYNKLEDGSIVVMFTNEEFVDFQCAAQIAKADAENYKNQAAALEMPEQVDYFAGRAKSFEAFII